MASDICLEEEFRNPSAHTCERCEKKFPVKKGYEFSPHCGTDDYGSQLYDHHKECRDGTFNNGSYIKCRECSSCPYPKVPAIKCNREADVVCCRKGEHVKDGRCSEQPGRITARTTESRSHPTSVQTTDPPSTLSPLSITPGPLHANVTVICVSLGICTILGFLCVFFIKRRQAKRHIQGNDSNGEMKGILSNERLPQTALYSKIKENGNSDFPSNMTDSTHQLLAPEVQAAPLNTVLNNLDVLEELVLLLDPDLSGVKNTRHLAAQCSFSFAWINYAYSKREHKSPLVTVLEGVVAKNPDWTVGHLAGLLTGIGRNDAVEILANLPSAL